MSPIGFEGPLRYATLRTTFVDQAVYVWVAALVSLEHKHMADIAGAVLTDALHVERELFSDLGRPLTKAFISFVSVEINPGEPAPFTSTLKEVVCSIWSEGQCGEPRPHAYVYFGRGASAPVMRTLLQTRRTLTARHPAIKVEWREGLRAINDNVPLAPKAGPIIGKLDGDNTECP